MFSSSKIGDFDLLENSSSPFIFLSLPNYLRASNQSHFTTVVLTSVSLFLISFQQAGMQNGRRGGHPSVVGTAL